jgi:hypothetical protein
MSSSSLSIAAGEANGQTPCERGGASPMSAPPVPVVSAAATSPDDGGEALGSFFGPMEVEGS